MTVYLDHAATTPLRPEAFAAMEPWLTTSFGNPSGGHSVARRARLALDEARESVAELLGCAPGEVVFTSGGTEADNLAVTGTVAAAAAAGRAAGAACSAIEHHAVLHAVEACGGRTIAVDPDGYVVPDALEAVVGPDVAVVSVMLANNEVGTVQDIAAIAERVATLAPQAVLHTDAVQAAPWLDLRQHAAPAQLVSVAAHKFGGPQGVGALVVRAGTPLRAQVLGGGQERELRSGTHNVAGIAGMAAALQAAASDRSAAGARVAALRDELVGRLSVRAAGVVETSPRGPRLPNIAHLRIDGVENESLLMLLDDAGVCAAAGSSCASGAMEPSHVLAAMGWSRQAARQSVRLSLGRPTTPEDVAAAVDAVVAAVARLRSPVRV